jgi:DNA processing protein
MLIGRMAARTAGAKALGIGARGLAGRPDGELAAMLEPREREEIERALDDRRPEVAGVCRHSAAYPTALAQLADPPAVLHCCGRVERLAELPARPAVTIVGGRRASPYALGVAAALGRDVAAAGATVVSGLALGVDAAAHRGATDTGTGVLGVLASGADVPYPRANAALYRRVRDLGAVVSEMPPGTPPARWAFPARNRIMAALAAVTVVVEAGQRSGSLITARVAGDLGHEVGAVPGQVTSPKAEGSNRLLRDGATVFLDGDDVLDALFGPGRDIAGGPRPSLSDRRRGEQRAAVEALEPPVRRVLDSLDSSRGVEAVGREAGVAPGLVRAALGRLELLGLVTRDGLGRYERTAAPRARGGPAKRDPAGQSPGPGR